jgi:hypothetical protein
VTATGREQILRQGIELSPLIRASQIVLAVNDATGHRNRLKAKRMEAGGNGGNIEMRMDGIAGAGVISSKFQQRLRRQACSATTKPDPRRGQLPQVPHGSQGWRGRRHAALT